MPTPLSLNRLTRDSKPEPAPAIEVLTIGEKNWGERIWIGGAHHGVEISRQLHFFHLTQFQSLIFTALRALNGERTLGAIAATLELPLDNFIRLVEYLMREELIVDRGLRKSSGTKESRRNLDRKSIEEINLPAGSEIEVLGLRERAKIEIVGHDRIATSLAALLYGSGIRDIRLSQDNYGTTLENPVLDCDLGGIALDGSDIGILKSNRFHQIANRNAIYPAKQEMSDGRYLPYGQAPFHANLTISIGYPRSDYHQRWLAEDKKFLIVGGFSQGRISVGPFVIPGYSPCLRCQQLTAIESDFWREQVRQLQQLGPQIPAPVAPAALIASLVAIEILDFIDRANLELPIHEITHPLIGQEWIFNSRPSKLLDPHELTGALRAWQRHPECGCGWALENGGRSKRITHHRSPT